MQTYFYWVLDPSAYTRAPKYKNISAKILIRRVENKSAEKMKLPRRLKLLYWFYSPQKLFAFYNLSYYLNLNYLLNQYELISTLFGNNGVLNGRSNGPKPDPYPQNGEQN